MPRDAPEDPPGFVVRSEAQKAAWDNGFRLGEIWRTASTWGRDATTFRKSNIESRVHRTPLVEGKFEA